jgi:hypothetical protein
LCGNSAGMANTVFVRGRSRVIVFGRSRSVCQDGVKRNYITRRLEKMHLGSEECGELSVSLLRVGVATARRQ